MNKLANTIEGNTFLSEEKVKATNFKILMQILYWPIVFSRDSQHLCDIFLFWVSWAISIFCVAISAILHGSQENDLSKRNQLAEDKPDVDRLDVRGRRQALHLAYKDGGQDQHGGQVHTQSCLEKDWLEECCGKGDCSEKEGREVGGHHLFCYLPLHDNRHYDSFFVASKHRSLQTPVDVLNMIISSLWVIFIWPSYLAKYWALTWKGSPRTPHVHILNPECLVYRLPKIFLSRISAADQFSNSCNFLSISEQ